MYRYDYIIKTDLKETGWEGMALSHQAEDKDKWSAVLNMVRNFRFHKIQKNS